MCCLYFITLHFLVLLCQMQLFSPVAVKASLLQGNQLELFWFSDCKWRSTKRATYGIYRRIPKSPYSIQQFSFLWCSTKICSRFPAQISGEKEMEKETRKFGLSAVSQICFTPTHNLTEVILNLAAVQNPKSCTEALTSITPCIV